MVGDYDAARDELRDAELKLMQQREAVASLRRGLPSGPVAAPYTFGSDRGSVTLEDLVGDRPLVLYHFMFGGPMAQPCPMCSMWADGWNGITGHLADRIDFALVTNATVEENASLATERGWTNLRWLSAARTSFKVDYGSGDPEGNQSPFITVFERDGTRSETPEVQGPATGSIDYSQGPHVRLMYDGAAHISGDHWRGVDLLSPVWHLLDLTRPGRGDFMP